MKGALLDENNFQEDLKKIEFYSIEERKVTNEIFITLETILNSYKSKQSNQLADLNSNLNLNFQTIDKNRQACQTVLMSVIERYHETAQQVKEIMERE